MNIFRRLLSRSTPAPSGDPDVVQNVVHHILDEGFMPAEAADSLAEMAHVRPESVELEHLTAEEFRNLYRPRIAQVPAHALQLLATVDVSEA